MTMYEKAWGLSPWRFGRSFFRITFFFIAFILATSIAIGRAEALTIADDATGGQCTQIGVWDAVTKTCTLTSDPSWMSIQIGSDNVTLDGNGHTIYGDMWIDYGDGNGEWFCCAGSAVEIMGRSGVTVRNLRMANYSDGFHLAASTGITISSNVIENVYAGIYAYEAVDNSIFSGNRITGYYEQSQAGIFLRMSDNNQVTANTITGCAYAVDFTNANGNSLFDNYLNNNGQGLVLRDTENSSVFHNIFVDNSTHALVEGGAGNSFNLPQPDGGNFWSGHTSPDVDGNRFVDNPFVLTGGQDDLPWIAQYAWSDYTGPSITSVTPAGQIPGPNTSIIVNYSDPAPSSGINTASVTVTLDGAPLAGCNAQAAKVTCAVSGLTGGTHSVGGTVADNAGNVSTINGSFEVTVVDTIAPSLVYTTSEDSFRAGVITLNANYSDAEPSAGVNTTTSQLRINGGSPTACTATGTPAGTITCVKSGLAAGHYTASISITDNSGNTGTTTGVFDVLPPFTIRDDATGGDCTLFGNWDASSKTCTMSKDLQIPAKIDGIQIWGNGIKLDGNGHTVRGSGGSYSYDSPKGVYARSGTAIRVENLTVENFGTGIVLTGAGAVANKVMVTGNVNDGIAAGSGTVTSSVATANGSGMTCYNGCTLSSNTISNNTTGVYLNESSNNTISSNMISNNEYGVILLNYSDNNNITGNSISGSGAEGIAVYGSSRNVITGNTVSNSGLYGIHLVSTYYYIDWWAYPDDNSVYGNNFVSNATQAFVEDGTGNTFNQALPNGGNYWSDWITPDADGNGFVDQTYTFSSGSDALPRTVPYGPAGQRPALVLERTDVLWASYADYLAGNLSVSFNIRNAGSNTAFNILVYDGGSNKGVELQSPMPAALGNFIASDSSSLTLRYHVPPGVGSFRTVLTATCQDLSGSTYTYP